MEVEVVVEGDLLHQALMEAGGTMDELENFGSKFFLD